MRTKLPCYIYSHRIFRKLIEIIDKHRCNCIALSGGIDTTTILLAAIETGLKPRGYTAIYIHGLPKDLSYVDYLSKKLNIDLRYVYIEYKDVEKFIASVVNCIGRDKINSHKDGGCIEIRNDIVFYAILTKARDDGCECIYVGSGGDELFAGYRFMLSLYEIELEEAIDRLSRSRYPELEIGRCVDIEVIAPLINEAIIDIVKEIPIVCLRSEKMLGKEVLREILDEKDLYIVSKRAKTPTESGAGTISICRSIYDA